MQIPHWQVLPGTEFWICDLPTQIFAAESSIFMAPHSQYSRGPLCSGRQQAVQITVQTFPEPVHLERVCRPSAWLTCSSELFNYRTASWSREFKYFFGEILTHIWEVTTTYSWENCKKCLKTLDFNKKKLKCLKIANSVDSSFIVLI